MKPQLGFGLLYRAPAALLDAHDLEGKGLTDPRSQNELRGADAPVPGRRQLSGAAVAASLVLSRAFHLPTRIIEMKNRQWLLARRSGRRARGRADFTFVETEATAPGEGEVFIRNLILSCDPTQRAWITATPMCRRSRSARSSARSARAGSKRRTIRASRPGDSCSAW